MTKVTVKIHGKVDKEKIQKAVERYVEKCGREIFGGRNVGVSAPTTPPNASESLQINTLTSQERK